MTPDSHPTQHLARWLCHHPSRGVHAPLVRRYEDHGNLWVARQDISCSLVYAAQHAPSKYTRSVCTAHGQPDGPCQHPIFMDSNAGSNLAGSGLILRPGDTPIACGKAADSGGHCGGWRTCEALSPNEVVTFEMVEGWGVNGDGCGGDWRPEDFGKYLERQATWQVREHHVRAAQIIAMFRRP